MAEKWNEKWNMDISALDTQHRDIFESLTKLRKLLQTTVSQSNPAPEQQSDECAYYNSLFGSLSTGELSYELELLIARVEAHFIFEERLHLATSYQLAISHKELHDEFLLRVKRYYAAHCQGEDVIEKLIRILEMWFRQHMLSDLDFGEMVKRNKIVITSEGIVTENPNASNWFTLTRKAISKLSDTP